MTSEVPTFTFSNKTNFQKTLATQKAKINNALAYNRKKVFDKEQQRRVAPSFQEITGGTKFQLTFHHGRKYDQEDLHAQDALKEAIRSRQVSALLKLLHACTYMATCDVTTLELLTHKRYLTRNICAHAFFFGKIARKGEQRTGMEGHSDKGESSKNSV